MFEGFRCLMKQGSFHFQLMVSQISEKLLCRAAINKCCAMVCSNFQLTAILIVL